MSTEPRDIMADCLRAMNTDRETARSARAIIEDYFDCDEVVIEDDGRVWVSRLRRFARNPEMDSVVRRLYDAGLVGVCP